VLIGPKGAGKTTCFNLLTKFILRPQDTIVHNGRDISKRKPADVAGSGLVRSFQISAVFSELSVLHNVRVRCSASAMIRLIFGGPNPC
jgi:branched-chain amino acid transport system ATP-binding protein